MRKINKLVVHHTASGRDITTLDMINNWHKARWADFQSSLGFGLAIIMLSAKTGSSRRVLIKRTALTLTDLTATA
jgi:hypothetical protein